MSTEKIPLLNKKDFLLVAEKVRTQPDFILDICPEIRYFNNEKTQFKNSSCCEQNFILFNSLPTLRYCCAECDVKFAPGDVDPTREAR